MCLLVSRPFTLKLRGVALDLGLSTVEAGTLVLAAYGPTLTRCVESPRGRIVAGCSSQVSLNSLADCLSLLGCSHRSRVDDGGFLVQPVCQLLGLPQDSAQRALAAGRCAPSHATIVSKGTRLIMDSPPSGSSRSRHHDSEPMDYAHRREIGMRIAHARRSRALSRTPIPPPYSRWPLGPLTRRSSHSKGGCGRRTRGLGACC